MNAPTPFALSTRWNASRHGAGEAMIEEIVRETGLTHVELGYDLTLDLVPGVLKMVAEGVVRVDSLHNFCPVPIGAPMGHPELFVLGSRDARTRDGAVRHTTQTIEFAAQVGAGVVVCHAGNVEMRRYTPRLLRLAAADKLYSPRYDRLKTRMLLKRDQLAKPYIEHLEAGIESLLPTLESHGVALAFENLPTWEALPTEIEIEAICRRFESPHVRYWHDIGHGQIRQNLGLSSQRHWIKRLTPWLAGVHVHDVLPPARDHMMPPGGTVDFAALGEVIPPRALRVLEPAPNTPAEAIRSGIDALRAAWPDLPDAEPRTDPSPT
jgi:sugar phosphate isomerase/epimerase